MVVDTDAIARALTGPGGAAVAAVAQRFGPAMIDASGAMDRAAMRALVFADPAARGRLEQLLHPLILQRCLQLAAQAGPVALLVFDVPLLLEAPAVRLGLALDRVLVVDCPPELQGVRAAARGSLDAAQIPAILASQAARGARLDLADDILVNAGRRRRCSNGSICCGRPIPRRPPVRNDCAPAPAGPVISCAR